MKMVQPQKTGIIRLEDIKHNVMNDGKYYDIINLPPHKSKSRPQMSNYDRAAQFSPFSALTGHGAAIIEAARLTSIKKELTEEEKYNISEKLRFVTELCDISPEIEIIYFVKDLKKDGGEYVKKLCRIVRIDEINRTLITSLSEIIPIDDVYSVEL